MLDKNIIKDGLIELGERAAQGDTEISWNDFCDVIEKYANGLMYPKPIGVSSGINALKSTLSVLTPATGNMAPALLAQGLTLLGMSIMASYPLPIGPSPGMGSGTIPTTPPVAPPVFGPLFAKSNELDMYATQMSVIIDSWFRTGIVDTGFTIPGAPPAITPLPSPWQ
tara:strand:- start:3511 stop:4014 length:504 start_codon:yes stop_codon:yes gene_type:complete